MTSILFIVLSCKIRQSAQKTIAHSDSVKASLTAIPFYPLRDTADLNVLIDGVGDVSVVLLGESTHGTSEFYKWRTEISKTLIKEKGFDFIAVEGDWGNGEQIDSFIKSPSADTSATVALLKQF